MEQAERILDVLPLELPRQEPIYTQWFYSDCGINMILTPVHTPPLDTEVGTARLNV